MNFGWLCINVGSSFLTNVPLWWRMVKMRKASHVWEPGVYGKYLYLLLNIAMNLK